MYTLVIDVGEKLRTVSDPETSAALQEELSQLQQCWGKTQALLEKKKMQFSGTLQVDDALPTCCSGIGTQELPCPTISRGMSCSLQGHSEESACPVSAGFEIS